jgi:hypothetical protein
MALSARLYATSRRLSGTMLRIRTVVEAAIGQRPAQALMKERNSGATRRHLEVRR